MTIYVDELQTFHRDSIKPDARQHGKVWCHMFADTDEELIAFAVRLGLRPEWAQSMGHPNQRFHHFDLVPGKRALAVKRGAVEISARDRAKETMALIEEGVGG